MKTRIFLKDGSDIGEKYNTGAILPVFRCNHIGIVNQYGFGVGVCPADKLPAGYEPLPDTLNRFSDQYGNYFHPETRSFYVYIPAFWSLANSAGLHLSPAEQAGHSRERAFTDSGIEHSGLMIMKYPMSVADDVMCSRPGLYPFAATTNPGTYSGDTTAIGLPAGLKTNCRLPGMSGLVPMSIFAYYMLLHLASTVTGPIRNPVSIDPVNGTGLAGAATDSVTKLMRNGLCWKSVAKNRTAAEMFTHNGATSGVFINPAQRLLLPGVLRYDGGLYTLNPEASVDSVTLGVVSTSLMTQEVVTVNIEGSFYPEIMYPENFTEATKTAYYLGYPALDTPIRPEANIGKFGIPKYDYSLSILSTGLAISNFGDYGHTLVSPTAIGDYTIRLMEFVL